MTVHGLCRICIIEFENWYLRGPRSRRLACDELPCVGLNTQTLLHTLRPASGGVLEELYMTLVNKILF